MTDLWKSPIFVPKGVQLVLAIVCALFIEGLNTSKSMWQIEFTHATIYSFILINLIIVISYIYGEPISVRLRIMISGVGTLFFLVSTIILIGYYTAEYYVSRRILAAGLLALINSVIFAADCYFTSKYIIE